MIFLRGHQTLELRCCQRAHSLMWIHLGAQKAEHPGNSPAGWIPLVYWADRKCPLVAFSLRAEASVLFSRNAPHASW